MFEAKLANAGLLKDLISVVYEIVKEDVAFKLSNDGIFMNAMDPNGISMITLRILRPTFDSYTLDEEQTAGIIVDRFYQILKQADAADTVQLKLEENMLKMTFKGRSTRTFSLPLVDVSGEAKKIPPLSFDASAVLKADVFSQGVSDAEAVCRDKNDSVFLISSPSSFTMRAGRDMGKSELKLEKGDEALIELQANGEVIGKYAIDYLMKIMKGSKLMDTVKIQYKTDFPIQMDFIRQDAFQLSFILAPREREEWEKK